MAGITSVFRDRWRSGKHVGAARPTQFVRIRRGEFRRAWRPWEGDDVGATLPGKSATNPWQAFWTPLSDWRTLPNVLEVNLEQDFNNNGITTATVEIDNLYFEERTGVAGTFHKILRGFFSPLRGYRYGLRPEAGVSQNEWYRFLDEANQIEVYQGYGDAMSLTFTGVFEDIDMTSAPDQLTITARDFGQALTDQYLLWHNKDPELSKYPVVFADRRNNDEKFMAGTAGPRDCSTALPSYPARFVADGNKKTSWKSHYRNGPEFTEFIQVRLRRGRYESFFMDPDYDNMEVYVSVYVRSKGNRPSIDGKPLPNGWIDLGRGDVPGQYGGHPFMHHYMDHKPDGVHHAFKHVLELGDDSVLRISFRNLRKVHADDGRYVYRAGMSRLWAVRREVKKEVKQNRIVLVDDVSDIVKVALRWAGFKEWDIESTGMRLPAPVTFNQGNTLMDIIKKCQEMTNYTFFMGDPSGGEGKNSIGVPVFRQANVFTPATGEQVTEDDLLTGMSVKWTREPLPYRIYVRGKPMKRTGEVSAGHALGVDQTTRQQAIYEPPWTRRHAAGKILKLSVQTYQYLKTQQELDVAARMWALNAALRAYTAIVEIPGNPAITLDEVLGVIDTGTGVNSRIYVASRSSSFHAGEEVTWKMTIGGALVDTPDIFEAAMDMWYSVLHPPAEPKDAVPIAKGGRAQTVTTGKKRRRSVR